MKDLTNLRKIAEAATPGPWEVCNVTEMDADGVTDLAHVLASELETEESVSAVAVSVIRHDATHIATFDPATALALITRLEQAEENLESALEANKRWAHRSSRETSELRKAEQAVARVRESLSNHPRACEEHPENDAIKCGWKNAVIDIQNALDGEPNE